jgi:hypothetical protein
MEKDRLIEEMLKDMGDRNKIIDLNAYGIGLIDMYDKLVKNCSIPVVVKSLPQDTDGCGNDRDKCSCKKWGGCPVD